MNKKGFIFVISASFLIAILMLFFLFNQDAGFSKSIEVEYKRINFANDFVRSFNQDLERALNIGSFRALIALEDHVASTGEFFNNTETVFIEALVNGSVEGSNSELMDDASLNEYLFRVNEIGSRFGLDVDVMINQVYFAHHDPWNLDVGVDVSVLIIDVSNDVFWNFTNYYNSIVPIENLRDPLYAVYTKNRVSTMIRKFHNDTFANGSDVSNLVEFMEGSYYVESNKSPSFIQRFSNDHAPNEFGIESLVNILELENQDLEVYSSRIKVDYYYFNDLDFGGIACDFEFIPENLAFAIPLNRLDLYQINHLNYSTDCEN